MNRRTKILLILIYGLVLVGLISRQNIILVLAIPFVVYLAAGIYSEPRELDFQVNRKLSTNRVRQGAPVTIRLEIINEGSTIDSVIIEDHVPTGLEIIEGNSRILTSLKSGERVSINYKLRGRRGLYHLPGIRTSFSDHLGLIRKHQDMELSNRIMVVPEAFTLPAVAIRPRRTRVYPGLIPARKGGAGVEFFGVREYHPGDPRRWINHRISARHEQTQYVNEFEQERAVDVGLILDCRVETNLFLGNQELLEYGTQATATLAETFLNYGNRVGLLIYGGGRNWVHPGYGKIQRERILQALAGVRLFDYVVSKELSNLPTRLFPANSQLVLISSLLYKDLATLIALRSFGYRLLVISPDPIDHEIKLLGGNPTVAQGARIARLEREFMIGQIKQTGARVIEWQVDRPFFQVANAMLTRSAVWHRNQVVEYA